jgi:hypothetical protein
VSAVQLIAILMLVGAGFIAGMVSLLGYMMWRMMRNDGWDDSNITNAQRLLSHVVLHSEDFGRMYYLSDDQVMRLQTTEVAYDGPLKKPFWYVSEDEFQGVVNTRPTA